MTTVKMLKVSSVDEKKVLYIKSEALKDEFEIDEYSNIQAFKTMVGTTQKNEGKS